jgi:hypothetical protein
VAEDSVKKQVGNQRLGLDEEGWNNGNALGRSTQEYIEFESNGENELDEAAGQEAGIGVFVILIINADLIEDVR